MKRQSRKTTVNTRFISIETLVELKRKKLPVKFLLQNNKQFLALSDKNRHLVNNIVYGVLRNRQYLDKLIAILCKLPINKMKKPVYQALSTGMYQLMFLDRIPPSAAVNETVNAIKQFHLPPKLSGFVNGVLRQAIRQQEELPRPALPQSENDVLNHPDWITGRWIHHYGSEQMVNICRANSTEPLTVLKVNRTRITPTEFLLLLKRHGFEAQKGRWAPDAVVIKDKKVSIAILPGYNEGFFHVQDQAAQLAVLLMKPFSADSAYLDGCAGLGGKTLPLLHDISQKKGTLTAVEPEQNRYHLLLENIQRTAEHSCITTENTTLQNFAAAVSQKFDGIFLDVPCSGTGVTGRHPDIRWNRTEQDIFNYAKTQRELLQTAASLLKKDGVLVYATCSIEPEENLLQIDKFLSSHPDFTLENCADFLPENAHEFIKSSCFTTLPSNEIDGFFAARLRYTGKR